MTLSPEYGETRPSFEELEELNPSVRVELGDAVTKAAIYDIEQEIQVEVAEQLLESVLQKELSLSSLLSGEFLQGLHLLLYQDLWSWAGDYRGHDTNIGVDWRYIQVELNDALGTILYRWQHTSDWTSKQLGIAVHAECVRVHPFADGNGRATRLLADLVFAAAQQQDDIEMYDWGVEKKRYVELLQSYDQHRDPSDLAAYIPTYTP